MVVKPGLGGTWSEKPSSVVVKPGLGGTWSKTPKRFSQNAAQIIFFEDRQMLSCNYHQICILSVLLEGSKSIWGWLFEICDVIIQHFIRLEFQNTLLNIIC